jgi:hypothetical protein
MAFFSGALGSDSCSNQPDVWASTCNNLCSLHTDPQANVTFSRHGYLKYVTVGVIILCYCLPLVFLYRVRNTVALKARSPKLIFIGITLLCLDSVSNTFIFSSDISNFRTVCDLSISCTVLFYFGVLCVYWLRMHRVEQVYLCYRKYLEQQLANVSHADISE